MDTAVDKVRETCEQNDKPLLFVVWIDSNCGYSAPLWWRNSVPKILSEALDEAANCRLRGFPTQILTEFEFPDEPFELF